MNAGPMHGSHAPGGSHRPADLDDELAAEGLELQSQRDELTAPGLLDPDQVEARSSLAQYLRPSSFPAGVDDLVAAAEAEAAPPSVIALLQQLPPGPYRTVEEVWLSLGGASESRHPVEEVDSPPNSPDSAPPPAPQDEDRPFPSWVEQLAQLAGATTTVAVRLGLGVPVAIVSRIGRLRPH